MSIRTKIDFSGITSDHIVTSDNKKYIHEDDEIFNSLKDEIAACENAQVQTELATLEILDIKEQTKVIANEAIDTATERAETAAQNAETAAQNAETAQALSELAAINALESERNVIEFSETLARLDEDNTFIGNNNFTGSLTINNNDVLTTNDITSFVKTNTNNTFSGTNNFTGSLTKNGNEVLTTSDASSFAKTNTNNTFSGTNNFTGTLLVGGKAVLTSEDTSNFAKLNVDNNFTGALTVNNKSVLTSSDSTVFAKTNANNTFSGTNNFTGSLTINNNNVLTANDVTSFAKTNANNTFSGTNNFTGTLQSKGNTVLTSSDASNYFKLDAANTISSHITIKDTATYINFGYDYNTKKGAAISLCSLNHATESQRGAFRLFARDATNSYTLEGRAYDGALLWRGKQVITQDTPHNIFFDQTSGTYKYLGYNQDSNKTVSGSYLKFNNANDTSAPGYLTLSARNFEKQATLGLSPDGTLTWTGSVISIGNKPAVTKISSGQATSVWHNHLSSGLLIQSNICSLSANATSDTITLSKPFDNTEYVVFVIFEDDKSNDATGVLSIMNKTTTSFKIHNGNGKGTYRWIAIGHSWDFS